MRWTSGGAIGSVGVLLAATAALGLAGCAAPAPRDSGWSAPRETAGAPQQAALVEHLERWRGTPYRLGGASRRGVDCSGFVQLTYARLFRRALPRTTERLRHAGREVTGEPLEAGDLVFFSIDGRDSHVGIYAGDGGFIHASSSRGVTLDRVDAPYWAVRHTRAVRVL